MAAQLRQQLQQGEAAVTARQGELADARRQLEAWQGKAAELCSIEIQLEQHVEDIFAAPAWRASPRQAELADALAALGAQSAEVGRGGGGGGGAACRGGGEGRGLQLLLQQRRREMDCAGRGASDWTAPNTTMHDLPCHAHHALDASLQAGRGATTYGGGAQLLKEAGQLLRAALQVSGQPLEEEGPCNLQGKRRQEWQLAPPPSLHVCSLVGESQSLRALLPLSTPTPTPQLRLHARLPSAAAAEHQPDADDQHV